jgi:hypothetical protein
MTAFRAISMRLSELFDLFDESIQNIPQDHKGPALAIFCSQLKNKHEVSQAEIDEGVRRLIVKDDYKNGFVCADGIVRRKEIVATRNVLVSKGEEMGPNGLVWRDVPRR